MTNANQRQAKLKDTVHITGVFSVQNARHVRIILASIQYRKAICTWIYFLLLNANTIQVIWERKSVHRHRYTSVQSSYYYHIVYTVYSILHRFNLWQDINGNMIRISYWMRSLLLLCSAATAAAMLKHVPFKTTATEKPVYCFENAFRSSRCWSSCF